MVIQEQQRKTFQRIYTETIDDLTVRLDTKTITADEFAGMLEALYVQDGNDWLGRGEAEQTVLSATIAAFEAILHSRPETSPRSPGQAGR